MSTVTLYAELNMEKGRLIPHTILYRLAPGDYFRKIRSESFPQLYILPRGVRVVATGGPEHGFTFIDTNGYRSQPATFYDARQACYEYAEGSFQLLKRSWRKHHTHYDVLEMAPENFVHFNVFHQHFTMTSAVTYVDDE